MTQSSNPRLQRFQRAKVPPNMSLRNRDKVVIQAVHEYRVLSTTHIQTLLFGSRQTAQDRLSKLYHNGYLERRAIPTLGGAASSPILYILDNRGAEILRSEFGMNVRQPKKDKRLGEGFLEHLMDTNTFRVAIAVAARYHGYKVDFWIDDMALKDDYDRVDIPTQAGRTRSVPVTPDSYFALTVPRGTTNFFLELDRDNLELPRFETKIVTYLHYYASGGYERRYKTKSLRVLTVVTADTPARSHSRLAALKKTTEDAGGHEVFYFTTLDEVVPSEDEQEEMPEKVLHQPIWRVAGSDELHPLIE